MQIILDKECKIDRYGLVWHFDKKKGQFYRGGFYGTFDYIDPDGIIRYSGNDKNKRNFFVNNKGKLERIKSKPEELLKILRKNIKAGIAIVKKYSKGKSVNGFSLKDFLKVERLRAELQQTMISLEKKRSLKAVELEIKKSHEEFHKYILERIRHSIERL